MTGMGLLAVALLGAGPLEPAAPAPSAHAHAIITPARPHLVLGVETEMMLAIEVRANESGVTFAPERATASIGTIASVTSAGDDHFTARFIAPAARFPQASIIVVDLVGGGQHLRASTCLPLHAAAQMPFHTSANASVSVRIETESFGPVRADAQGNVTIPIVVPPGIRDGIARATDADGNTRETTVDLQPAPFAQMLIVAAPQLEVGSFSEVSTFGVTTRGEPIAQGSTTLRASEGMVHPLGSGAPGEERFLIEAPQKVGGGAMHLTASAVDVAPEPLVVLDKRAEAVIQLVPGTAEQLMLSPSTDHLIIGEDATATVALIARDRHDNPASCAGAEVTVDGQDATLKPDDPTGTPGGVPGPPAKDSARQADLRPREQSCGQIAIPAPPPTGRLGSVEVEARLGELRARTFIRVTPGPAVRLAASVSSPAIVGDGKQSVEVRVDAFDKTGRPAIVPPLTWQAAGGRVGPQRQHQIGSYVTDFTPNRTQATRAEVLVVKGDPSLSATTVVQVQPPRARLTLSARLGLFTNFGGMAGPIAFFEALRALPGRADAWAVGVMVGILHNDLTTTSTNKALSDTMIEIGQVPTLAIVQYRLPVPLGVDLTVGGGVGFSLAHVSLNAGDRSWPESHSTARALAAEARANVAFPLGPGELVVGAHYVWIDLGRTSQGDDIQGNSVGFVGDVGYRMAW